VLSSPRGSLIDSCFVGRTNKRLDEPATTVFRSLELAASHGSGAGHRHRGSANRSGIIDFGQSRQQANATQRRVGSLGWKRARGARQGSRAPLAQGGGTQKKPRTTEALARTPTPSVLLDPRSGPNGRKPIPNTPVPAYFLILLSWPRSRIPR